MSFANSPWVWRNGGLVPWAEATIHVSAHGLHYGTGVFEGIRCYATADGPAVFRLREHLERLLASAGWQGMPIPYSIEELEEGVCELVRRSGYESCYIRPLCFRGSRSLHLNPKMCPVEVAILAWPWERYLNPEQAGARICVSAWRKFHSSMMPTTAKACGQYLNSVLATQEAAGDGYDEALLLDQEGGIAEGAGENLFVVRRGRLITNDQRHSILMGITRDAVLTLARERGYPVVTRGLELDDLLTAEEAFFTGTAAEVTAIREVDGRRIGGVTPGRVTAALQSAFAEATSGRDEAHRDWLRPVRAGAGVEA